MITKAQQEASIIKQKVPVCRFYVLNSYRRVSAGPRVHSSYINQSKIESIFQLSEGLCEVVHWEVNSPLLL